MSILKIVIVIVIENLIIIIFLCRTMFHELRLSLEHFAYSPKCPSFLKGIIYKVNTKICWNECFVNSKCLTWIDLGESEQNLF